MLYRDFPAWLKLVTVLLTVALGWALWRGVDAIVDRMPDGPMYVLGAVVALAVVGMIVAGLLIDRRRKARRADDVRPLQNDRDRPRGSGGVGE